MRTKYIAKYLEGRTFAVEPNLLVDIVALVNSGNITKKQKDIPLVEGSSLEIKDNVAIIRIDGTTIKKNTQINAMCGEMVGYDTILGYFQETESNEKVSEWSKQV